MRKSLLILVLGMTLAGAALAGPPAGGKFVVAKNTIDGGGGASAGGQFELTGTIGQWDASVQSSIGGDFALSGGFWAHMAALSELIFRDGFEE